MQILLFLLFLFGISTLSLAGHQLVITGSELFLLSPFFYVHCPGSHPAILKIYFGTFATLALLKFALHFLHFCTFGHMCTTKVPDHF